MPSNIVLAPVTLLQSPVLTPSAKLVWLVMRHQTEPVSLRRLAASALLAPRTAGQCLTQLAETGWYAGSAGASAGGTGSAQRGAAAKPAGAGARPAGAGAKHAGAGAALSSDQLVIPLSENPEGPQVIIPARLLYDPNVRPRGKVLYGLLQTIRPVRHKVREFTHEALGALLGVSSNTVAEIIRELALAEWVEATRANRRARVRLVPLTPEQDRVAAHLERTRLRLEDDQFTGEAIMQAWLNLLIDFADFEENARPGFLINPITGEPMELDRYYPGIAAFEFNGPQHFHTTKRFPSEHALAMRQARDLMKEAILSRRGIPLVVIVRDDLQFSVMREKVGNLLPLRDLRGYEPVIEYLEQVSAAHRRGPVY